MKPKCSCNKPPVPTVALPDYLRGPAVAAATAVRSVAVTVLPGVRSRVIGSNPRRVGLGFTGSSAPMGSNGLMPLAGAWTGQGWNFTTGNPLWFDLNTHAPLVSCEWWMFSSGGLSLTVIEAYLL